jgi:hypothetical protein
MGIVGSVERRDTPVDCKFVIYFFGGISGGLVLVLCIPLVEILCIKLGGNFGDFLWTTFHFIVNPILCLIYIAITIAKAFRIKKTELIALYFTFMLLALLYIFVAVTGNITWAKMIMSLAKL